MNNPVFIKTNSDNYAQFVFVEIKRANLHLVIPLEMQEGSD